MVSAEFQMRYQKRISAYDVICSGFFDSVGLYQSCTEEQHQTVREWIGLLKMEDMATQAIRPPLSWQQRLILLARAMVKSPLLMSWTSRATVSITPTAEGSGVHRVHRQSDGHRSHLRDPPQDELPLCITHALVLDKGRSQPLERGSKCWAAHDRACLAIVRNHFNLLIPSQVGSQLIRGSRIIGTKAAKV